MSSYSILFFLITSSILLSFGYSSFLVIVVSFICAVVELLSDKLKVDDILYCMHDDPDVKGCRKPAAGLIIKAKNKWNISLQHSFMIGDTEKDLGAAKNAGVKFLLINRNYNENINVSDRINKLTDITLYLD